MKGLTLSNTRSESDQRFISAKMLRSLKVDTRLRFAWSQAFWRQQETS